MSYPRSLCGFSHFRLRLSGLGPRLSLLLLLAAAPALLAQQRPTIGFVYPAGGQQGTTVQIRLGGQGMDDITGVLVTGTGVQAKLTDYYRRLSNQEVQLLNEQVRALKRAGMSASARASLTNSEAATMMADNTMMMSSGAAPEGGAAGARNEPSRHLLAQIEKRTSEWVNTPACAAIAALAMVEVTLAPEAEPGEREIRLVTVRGVSNPLPFHVGQVPEVSHKPMLTATKQILGKEAEALRKRVPGDDTATITLPCTVNGQIASAEVHHYRFQARQGQRLVVSALGRQLVPFIADAVPGWFQPVLTLYDAKGKEVAYEDDYQFKPDPTLFYEVPRDGEYEFTIRDSIYRGREDFVYRITAGELPFITSLFPLGGRVAAAVKPEAKGWNLQGAELDGLPAEAEPGIRLLAAKRKDLVSNRVPFALDQLPEAFEREGNNTPAKAQKVSLPVVINGRIDRPDDWDVFQFTAKSNDTVVAEVMARRLDSPLDSVLKLTDAAGNPLALNDDHEDLTAGLNTHAADSWLMARLPADGVYYVHIGDTARQGGENYGYRLRLSPPQPAFDLRVTPSSLSLRSKSAGTLTVYAQRKDGFAGPIKLALKDPPAGFSAQPVTLLPTQTVARITLRTTLVSTEQPVSLAILGTAKAGERELASEAVPAEDRMQAFLWRHLVPAKDLQVLVYDPNYQPPPKRVAPERPPSLASTNAPAATDALAAAAAASATNSASGTNALAKANKPKFSKQQVAFRLRQLKLLYQDGLLTDDFYNEKVAECEAAE